MRQEMHVLGCISISWTICKQYAPRCRQITTPTPHQSIFTGQMHFQKGKACLDLNEAGDACFGMHQHQLDHMQTVCTSLQTDNHTNTSSVNFYRPDALPDAQPTLSKH